MEHTKGPWKAIIDPSGEAIYIRHNGYIIAKLDNRRGLGEPEANAEFIVRACNSHDDLLEALEFALVSVQWMSDAVDVDPDKRLEIVTKAIQKAKA